MIREARPDEWEALRELRLRSLAESPAAFARSAEEEQAFPEAVWRERAASHPDRAVFVLEGASGDLAGAAVGLDEGDAVRVGGMWVAPERRGEGHGRALIEAVLGWARGPTNRNGMQTTLERIKAVVE